MLLLSLRPCGPAAGKIVIVAQGRIVTTYNQRAVVLMATSSPAAGFAQAPFGWGPQSLASGEKLSAWVFLNPRS